MKFVFVGGEDAPDRITWKSRFTGKEYTFERHGEPVEVDKGDVESFAAHSEFKPAPTRKPAAKKKAAKKKTK